MAKNLGKQSLEARMRLAKRAKRQKFIKDNKRSLIYGFVALIVIVAAALLTPWGPNYYYARIQGTKMESPGTVRAGALTELKKLGVFYYYTMRKDEALKTFDEIGTLYFGMGFSEFGRDPEAGYEKHDDIMSRMAKGLTNGPPYKVSDADLSAVGEAMYYVGDILSTRGGKQFQFAIYKQLYQDDFRNKHPDKCLPDVNEAVDGMVRSYLGY